MEHSKIQAERYADSSWVEGAVSVSAVLRGASREIFEILLSEGADRENRHIAEVINLAAGMKIPLHSVPEEEISRLAAGKSHGGLMAKVGQRRFKTVQELFSQKNGFVFMLCGIEDPYNFGDAVRSLYAFGASGMILSPRNWLSAASITARSSAGASELIDCAVCEDETALAEIAKKHGYRIVCAEEKEAVSLHRAKLAGAIFLVIGGEKRGISAALSQKADVRVRIPYGRNFNRSLTTCAAASAIGYEIMRQTRQVKFKK